MTFWTLYKKELGSYFISPVAYVVLFASAICMGAYFTLVFNYMALNDVRDYTVMQMTLMGVFFWVTIIQVPLITMRAFSEEFKLGTIEMLLTAPVNEWEVVLAKYFGALTFFLVLWMPLFVDIYMLTALTRGGVPVVWTLAGTSFLGLLVVGMFYVAVGIFTSILTRNQIVAAILSFGIIFFYFTFGYVSFIVRSEAAKNFIAYFTVFEHMKSATMGLLDTRSLVLYLSGAVMFLFLTQRLLLSRRLRG